jgi:hypothetical protein
MRTLLWSYLGQRQFPREMSRFEIRHFFTMTDNDRRRYRRGSPGATSGGDGGSRTRRASGWQGPARQLAATITAGTASGSNNATWESSTARSTPPVQPAAPRGSRRQIIYTARRTNSPICAPRSSPPAFDWQCGSPRHSIAQRLISSMSRNGRDSPVRRRRLRE